jgi:uncharacterized protein (TIGR00290 family)
MPTPVVLAWSGGKDSSLALWTLRQDPSFEVRALLTTLTEGYSRVSTSGIREEILDRQARAAGLPVIKTWIPQDCSIDTYNERMGAALSALASDGVEHVAFADLYLQDVRAYREEQLALAGMHGVFPLFGRDTAALAREYIALGFEATLVCVDPRHLDPSFAGRRFDDRLLADLPAGIDPCGENGEFHSCVHAGPIFDERIACRTGEVVTRGGFVFCDIVPQDELQPALPKI